MNWELKTDSLSVLLRVPPLAVSLSLSVSSTLSVSLSLFKSGWAGSVTYREEREGVCEQTSEEYRLQKLALFLSFTLSLIILDKKGAKLSSSC